MTDALLVLLVVVFVDDILQRIRLHRTNRLLAERGQMIDDVGKVLWSEDSVEPDAKSGPSASDTGAP